MRAVFFLPIRVGQNLCPLLLKTKMTSQDPTPTTLSENAVIYACRIVGILGMWDIDTNRSTINVITNNRINIIYINNLCRINLLSCGVLMSVGYYRHNTLNLYY